MTPDFRLLYRKDLLVDYISAIYPADRPKFTRWTVKRLKAAIINISKRKVKEAVNEVS